MFEYLYGRKRIDILSDTTSHNLHDEITQTPSKHSLFRAMSSHYFDGKPIEIFLDTTSYNLHRKILIIQGSSIPNFSV